MSKVNLDKIKKKYKDVKERAETGPFWTPKDGDNRIRILPPVGKMGDEFYVEGAMHYNVGPDGDIALCPKLTHKNPCPICDTVDELFATNTPEDVKLGKAMRPKARFWMNILDMSEKGKGPQVFGCGIKLFKDILSYFTDEDYGDLTDLKEGRDIVIEKSGKGIDTEYHVKPRPKVSVVKKEILDKAIDLKSWDVLVGKTEAELLELLGIDGGDMSDLKSMSRKELKEYIKENDLDIKVTKKMSEDDIRKAIEDLEPEEEEEEEEEEEKEESEDEDDDDEDDDDEESEDEDEDEDEDGDDLDEMDRTELKAYIKESDLDVKVTKKMSEDDIREAIREAESEDEEEEEEEEPEPPKRKKKGSK